MEPYKLLVTGPIIVASAWVGAVMMNPRSGLDIFPLFWWAMTAALTALFLAMIRWGFGDEGDTEGVREGARGAHQEGDRREDSA